MVGVSVGLVILSMCISGTLLAFEPQIVDFAERHITHVSLPNPEIPRLSPGALASQVQQAYPDHRFLGLTQESDPTAVAVVRLSQDKTLYLNPYTGAMVGEPSRTHEVLHTVEMWHRWFCSKAVGKPITGTATLLFLGLAISGIYLWWPRQGAKAVLTFAPDLKGRARDWNWHNVFGFWLSPFIVILTLTGTVMSFAWANTLLFRATGNKPPARPAERTPAAPEQRKEKPKASLDLLWTRAEAQVPGWKSISLRIPEKGNGPISFFIRSSDSGQPTARARLSLDPYTAEVMKWEPYSSYNGGQKLRAWVTPVHTGRAWGWPGQLLNLLIAIGGLFLVWTGFALAWRRFQQFRRKSTKDEPAKRFPGIR